MVIGIDGSRAFEREKTGTEWYSWEMIRALARTDKVNRYVIYVKNGWSDQQSSSKFKVQSSKLKFKIQNEDWPENFEFVEIPWPRLWTQGGLAMQTWTDKLDVLWVPAHTLPVLGNPKLPMVVTIHAIEYEYLPGAYKWGQNLHLTWSTRWAVKRANKIVAVSGKTKEDLVEKLGAEEGKIEVVWEGVDLRKFQITNDPPSQSYGRASKLQKNSKEQKNKRTKEQLEKYDLEQPYVLFVGTVQPRKNLVRLIEAFGKIVSSFEFRVSSLKNRKINSQLETSNLQLVVVGKMGWDYEEILNTPKRLRIEDRVKFVGYVSDEDLVGLYQGASLYVEPSLQEGFGLPVLEAMAAGVPVVAARAGALPEVIGEAGVLVDPESIESILEAMAKILKDEKLRKELVKRGYERVKEFGWEEGARKLVKMFEEMKL